MNKICAGVLLAAVSLGCSSDAPPGAVVTKDVTLPDSSLTHLQKVSLLRAGGQFILAGYDSDAGWVRWGRLSLDGVLTEEAGFALAPPPLAGPVFAATTKTTPGDQLVAIVLTSSATPGGGYDLSAVVQTVGDSAAAAPVALVKNAYAASTDPSTVQITAGAATTGNVGFVAWGVPGTNISPSYLLLPADAVTAATPSLMFSPPRAVPNWDCLATSNGTTGLGFSVVTPDVVPGTSDLISNEVSEAGDSIQMTYQFIVVVANCQIVASPGPAGSFVMAMQTSNAIDFAMYYPPPPNAKDPNAAGSVTTNDPVLPAANFGDPLNMPHPAWASPASGGDISIGLARASGPQVYRYTYNAIPHGSPLTLRSQKGQTGPVASWVGSDVVYVTYTDQAITSPASVKRYFMRLESPALP
jgi:hypothetical protein